MSDDERVVVIGSGPPGATAALFLARTGVRVLLLEAGTEQAARGATLRIQGVTVAKRKRPLLERDGLLRTGHPGAQLNEEIAPGGLSNHWSCAVPRFSAEDFADARRAGPEHCWPLGYEDLAPWYARVEPLLHIASGGESCVQLPSGIRSHDRRLGDDWSELARLATQRGRSAVPMPYAYGGGSTWTPSGTPFNSFVRLLAPELGRSDKIVARFGARAVKLLWSASRRRVEAVLVRDRSSGREEQLPCRAVIVAAGALNTPQVLLESKSADFPNGLGNEHGVLGRYLNDHPLGKLVIGLDRAMSIHPAAYVTRLSLAHAKQPLYAAACMQWCSSSDLAKSVLQGHPKRQRTIGFSVFGTMAPNADDYVAVNDAYQAPDGTKGLELHINHPPEALPALEEARDQLLALLSDAGWEPRVQVWKVENPGNSNHYAGSCRMHAEPRFGMLNGWSRLHAVPNVMVADSSVFTTNPEKNPVLTSMTLAARAADRLAAELASGDL